MTLAKFISDTSCRFWFICRWISRTSSAQYNYQHMTFQEVKRFPLVFKCVDLYLFTSYTNCRSKVPVKFYKLNNIFGSSCLTRYTKNRFQMQRKSM